MREIGSGRISRRGRILAARDLREGPGMAFLMSARGSPGPGRVATVAIAAAKVGSAPDSVRHRRAPNVGDGEKGGVRALTRVRGRKAPAPSNQ